MMIHTILDGIECSPAVAALLGYRFRWDPELSFVCRRALADGMARQYIEVIHGAATTQCPPATYEY